LTERETIRDDLELLNGLSKQDPACIKVIYKENYPIIQAFVIKNSGSEEDAQDIFQESMIVLYEKTRNKSFELTSKISTYVYSVCRHLWLKKLQQQGKQPTRTIEGFEEFFEADNELERHEQKEAILIKLEASLENLGEPCSSLIKAFYLEKQNMQTIAERFGYTNAENAKTQKYKCFIRLKRIFFEHHNKTT
jgi:RNA polymerase sigma factor (sigma-70 family)